MTRDQIILLSLMEVAPPGREPQVRALKKKGNVDNPYAVAWASYNGEEGGPGSGRHPYGHGQKGSEKLYNKQRKLWNKKMGNFKVVGRGRSVAGSVRRVNTPKIGRLTVKSTAQANSSGGLSQTLRGQKQSKTMCGYQSGKEADITILKLLMRESVEAKTYRFSESSLMEVVAPVQLANKETVAEGPMVKCVLITEGLGNRADMHYYGPECIQAAVPLFEGQPCFIDHQKRSDVQDQPERTVRDKCGYFKNVRAEQVDGRIGLVAELHYDLSETGRYAYDKACTAIHYKQEFPGSDKEYVGLSIAADGKLEERTMQVGDEVLDVKYVTEFTAVGSVDEVTSPARGGRFVAVLSR